MGHVRAGCLSRLSTPDAASMQMSVNSKENVTEGPIVQSRKTSPKGALSFLGSIREHEGGEDVLGVALGSQWEAEELMYELVDLLS